MEYILYILVTTTQLMCANIGKDDTCRNRLNNEVIYKQVQFWQYGGLFQPTILSNTLKVDGLAGCNNAAKELNLKTNEFKCVRSK